MDTVRIGRQYRALRVRKELRQVDIGQASKLSRAVISRIERGLLESVTIGTLVRAAAPLGAVVDVRLRWNGEQLDRLLDEAHARLVDKVVVMLRAAGLDVAVEVSFSVWGERGSIDVLAFHRGSGTVLTVEVKSAVPDSQATIHGLDRKARLAPQLATERGWECRAVARMLVIGSSPTSRRRVAQLAATYDAVFPMRGRVLRRWLRKPEGVVSGLLFVSYAPRRSGSSLFPGRQRVRPRRPGRGGRKGPPDEHMSAWSRDTSLDLAGGVSGARRRSV
jgi:transcriptional regulator with XRE-family HTH domain